MSDDALYILAEKVGHALRARGLVIVTAESCTGGWVSEAITAIPGSSAWFERGFVTYSNRAKQEMLGVKPGTLLRHGAVSEPTVVEMVEGALLASKADVALAISGIAGPDGGTPDKPVGTVCFGWQMPGQEPVAETRWLAGDRTAVRREAVLLALQGMLDRLEPL